MTRKFLGIALVLAMMLSLSSIAMAQDDDAAEWVTFTAPAALDASSEYTFTFEVFNISEAESGVGIQQVDIVLPNENYGLTEEGQPAAPSCINADCDRWEMYVDTEAMSITWQSYGMVSTVAYGDIREQDVQTFSFVATTDEAATDGFNWSLWGEDGALVAEGTWNFGAGDDDDDDDDDDTIVDDDDSGDDDDDDDGCGC